MQLKESQRVIFVDRWAQVYGASSHPVASIKMPVFLFTEKLKVYWLRFWLFFRGLRLKRARRRRGYDILRWEFNLRQLFKDVA